MRLAARNRSRPRFFRVKTRESDSIERPVRPPQEIPRTSFCGGYRPVNHVVHFIAGKTAGSEFLEVWYEGYREPLAIRADTIEGWVERYVLGADGRVELLMGEPRTQRVYGRVEIKQC